MHGPGLVAAAISLASSLHSLPLLSIEIYLIFFSAHVDSIRSVLAMLS